VAGELVWTAERAGTAHGLLVWFDAELADGIGFSNAPGQPELIYGQAFFPLQEPVTLVPGDVVTVQLRADLVDDDYVWRWGTRVTPQGDSGRVKANFKQSTFYGAPLSLDKLKRREAGFVPQPLEAAEIDRFVLSMFDGRTSLGEIATGLLARYPERFARQRDALTHAADLAERYRGPK
jgi:protein arginine N-methyltransferase 1